MPSTSGVGPVRIPPSSPIGPFSTGAACIGPRGERPFARLGNRLRVKLSCEPFADPQPAMTGLANPAFRQKPNVRLVPRRQAGLQPAADSWQGIQARPFPFLAVDVLRDP